MLGVAVQVFVAFDRPTESPQPALSIVTDTEPTGRATMAEQVDWLEWRRSVARQYDTDLDRLRAIAGPQPHRFSEQSGTSAPATPENAHTRVHCGSKDSDSSADSSAFPLTSFEWTPDLSELDRPPVVGALSE